MLLYMKMSKRKLEEVQGVKQSKRRQAVKSGRKIKSRDMHFLLSGRREGCRSIFEVSMVPSPLYHFPGKV